MGTSGVAANNASIDAANTATALAEGGETRPTQRARDSTTNSFSLIWDDELANLPKLTWDVEGILAHGSLGVIYGAPASAKTFAALSLAFAVATGQPWFGRSVRKGRVVYVYAEGVHGLGERVRALKMEHHVVGRSGIAFLPRPLQLLDHRGSVAPFVDAITQTLDEPPALVIIDTLSRNMPGGNENGQEDMSRVVLACDRLRDHFGCSVLLLHHTAKGVDTIRGNSVLMGAVDVAIFAKRARDTLTLNCKKQRSAAEFEPIPLQFAEAHGSRVLRPAATTPVLQEKMTELQRGILEYLPGVEDGSGWSTSTWCSAAVERLGISPSSFYGARKWLVERGYVDSVDGGRAYCQSAKAAELLHSKTTPKMLQLGAGHTTPVCGGTL